MAPVPESVIVTVAGEPGAVNVRVADVVEVTVWAVIAPIETVNVGLPGVPGVHSEPPPVSVRVIPVPPVSTVAGETESVRASDV